MRDSLEVNQSELAKILGKTTRLIRYYQDQGLPSRAEGAERLYFLPEVIPWIIKRQRADALERSEIMRRYHSE